MDKGFYETLTQLVKLGSAGVGVAIFLMVFILLMRGQPIDQASARLREKFLIYGTVFAGFCGVLALIPLFLPSDEGNGRPLSMRLSFSPDFQSESLTPPKVKLPDGTISKPDEKFDLSPSRGTQVLTIAMDTTLKEVKSLRTTSAVLAESVAAVQQQRNALAESMDAGISAPAPATEAQDSLRASSAETEGLQREVTRSLNAGDYGNATALSVQLRNSVIRARPAVREIARPQP